LAIRLIYLLLVPAIPTVVDLDAVDYDQIARNVANGDGFGYGPNTLTSFRPPLYPLFLAAIYKIIGLNHGIVRLLQVILGACIPAVVYLAARQRFPRTESQVSAIICALYPALIGTTHQLMTEAIYIPLLTLAILSLIMMEDQPTWGRVLLSGILLGLTLLARASAATLLLLIPFWMFWRFPKARVMGFVKGVVIGLVAVITVLPWTARNWSVHQTLIPISSNGGHIFWLGFHQLNRAAHQDFRRAEAYRAQEGRRAKTEIYFQLTAEDNTLGFPMLQRVYAEQYPDVPLPPNEAQLNRAYFARTVEFMESHPAVVLIKVIKDTLRVPYFFDHFGRFVFSWGCLFPFAIAGLWITRRRWRELSLLYVLFLSLILLEVVFHPTPRFRLPYEPFLILFGGTAAVRLFQRFRPGNIVPYLIVGVVLVGNMLCYLYSDSVRHLFRALAGLLGLPVEPN
jgi:4-amino-4-deoxy-L-arabinose transferase-like glycosyltransferase